MGQRGAIPVWLILLVLVGSFLGVSLLTSLDPLGLKEKLGLDKESVKPPSTGADAGTNAPGSGGATPEQVQESLLANLSKEWMGVDQEQMSHRFPWPRQIEFTVTPESTGFVLRAPLFRPEKHSVDGQETLDWLQPPDIQVLDNQVPGQQRETNQLFYVYLPQDDEFNGVVNAEGFSHYFDATLEDPELDGSQFGELPYQLTLYSKEGAFEQAFKDMRGLGLRERTLYATLGIDYGLWQNGLYADHPVGLKIHLRDLEARPTQPLELFAYYQGEVDDYPNVPGVINPKAYERVVEVYAPRYPNLDAAAPLETRSIRVVQFYRRLQEGTTGPLFLPLAGGGVLAFKSKGKGMAARTPPVLGELIPGSPPRVEWSFEFPRQALTPTEAYGLELTLNNKKADLRFARNESSLSESTFQPDAFYPVSYAVAFGEAFDPEKIRAEQLARLAFLKVNHQRLAEGLPPLQWDSRLAIAAQAHSQAMAENAELSHTVSGERELAGRLLDAGLGGKAKGWAENIASIPLNGRSLSMDALALAEEAVSLWMHSSGHETNILNPAYTHAGMGIAIERGYAYFTQDFAGLPLPVKQKKEALPVPLPAPTAPLLPEPPTCGCQSIQLVTQGPIDPAFGDLKVTQLGAYAITNKPPHGVLAKFAHVVDASLAPGSDAAQCRVEQKSKGTTLYRAGTSNELAVHHEMFGAQAPYKGETLISDDSEENIVRKDNRILVLNVPRFETNTSDTLPAKVQQLTLIRVAPPGNAANDGTANACECRIEQALDIGLNAGGEWEPKWSVSADCAPSAVASTSSR
ncbi:MAG: CAP domain-containing protein [Candidatus Diapherotrites archaeon]|uniref:CAP domain-containing protein n=1 Tax=Candidatus Iainarchaeum sp. TaxID=3101447 RepID=A0A8T4LFX5_9ARCH|nr:CAP domain-containing protein [Candidatus Diapherotrites archaeon]